MSARPHPRVETRAKQPALDIPTIKPVEKKRRPMIEAWDALKRRWIETRVDRSRAGFDAAVAEAVARVQQYRWRDLTEAADEIALTLGEKLNVADVGARFVALHAASGKRRCIFWAGSREGRADLIVNLDGA